VGAGGDSFDSPLKHFIASLRGMVEPISTAEIALNTMLILEGIYRSEELRREVSAEEIMSDLHPDSLP
jgi:predicted dehydrogenase